MSSVSKRLLSIDVLRGLTVFFMILVNNNGNNDLAFHALNHSAWNGFTPTDLVFPAFLFIMGISMVLSFSARKQFGATTTQQLVSIVRRFVLLVLLGLLVNGFPYFHLDTLRIYGVLQRIAVCYLLAALLQLWSEKITPRIVLLVTVLTGYWVLLRYVPVPEYGVPTHGFPLLDRDINIVAWTDRHIFPGRLFEGTRDPEGLLSNLSAFASTLLGLLAGSWLQSTRSAGRKVIGLLCGGVFMILAGLLWSESFPINKKLWTSSYVLYAAGWSTVLLTAFYHLIEVKGAHGRWVAPFQIFGMNAITAYVLSELLSSAVAVFHVNTQQSIQQFVYSSYFIRIGTPAAGSLLYSFLFVAVCFIPALLLYRSRIFIKL